MSFIFVNEIFVLLLLSTSTISCFKLLPQIHTKINSSPHECDIDNKLNEISRDSREFYLKQKLIIKGYTERIKKLRESQKLMLLESRIEPVTSSPSKLILTEFKMPEGPKNVVILNLVTVETKQLSKIHRLLIIFLLSTVISLVIFLYIKSSIEWSGTSQMTLNKMQDEHLNSVTDEIINVFKTKQENEFEINLDNK